MSLAGEILERWAPVMRTVELRAGTRGSFEVTLDGELVFSKRAEGRHAKRGEITSIIERRIGPPLDWRQGE